MDDDDKPARYADDANIPPEREHDTHEAETLPAPPSEEAPEVVAFGPLPDVPREPKAWAAFREVIELADRACAAYVLRESSFKPVMQLIGRGPRDIVPPWLRK